MDRGQTDHVNPVANPVANLNLKTWPWSVLFSHETDRQTPDRRCTFSAMDATTAIIALAMYK